MVAKSKMGVKSVIKIAGRTPATRKIEIPNDWRKIPNKADIKKSKEFQGLQVFYPVDPYTTGDRKEFRSAMGNVYVYRAARILTTFVAGQGYTTKIVPRIEEELSDEELDAFKQNLTYVPYWDEEITYDELKDRIDKMAVDMKLDEAVFNGYLTSLEQGRCVLALTPLDPEEIEAPMEGQEGTEKYPLPKEIRYVRPEFTLRPILDANTAELIGCYIVGSRSITTPSAIDAKRMIYITHAFNNELFSDFYGDSKIARIADIANNLNLILNQDFERVAEHTWHQPKVWAIPIPPQEVGNEENILEEFLSQNNENAKGRDIAVAMSSVEDERKPELLNASTNSGDISGLEVIRQGLIKAVITAFGIPGFMLSEGDIGSLGGNANIEEVDMFINTEVRPERLKLENILENQFYDRILCILYDIESEEDLPVKLKHTYNKPTLLTLLTPEMINSLQTLVQNNWIDPSAVLQILHLEQYESQTNTEGEDVDPSKAEWKDNEWEGQGSKGWDGENPIGWNNENNGWGKEEQQWGEHNRWGKTPMGSWYAPSQRWASGGIGKRRGAKLRRHMKKAKMEPQIVNKVETITKTMQDKSPLSGIMPSKTDLNDPNLKLQWAKVEAARELAKQLEKDRENE
ncbi:MAG: hypothetical protein D4R96_03350 [Nitrosopumilaceae archaeon]|nr:MAG: hypothetical protein D4R96_03350 [Nitrosopumilaceae archaeon]